MSEPPLPAAELPLVVLLGPTASGKTALALHLAERLGAQARPAEILSCDSVALFRGMDVGSAKPSAAERARVPHHLLDLLDPCEESTAGDYARAARAVLGELRGRAVQPILAGGTGLYARALLDGLSPAPGRDDALRALLLRRAARRGPGTLHRTLKRLDPAAAARIHTNDTPKLVRAIEVSVAARRPMSQQWLAGRDALRGYRVLRLVLAPPRAVLSERIDRRAQGMFERGLVEETRALLAQWGPGCRALGSLGYAQAAAVVRGEMEEADAIRAAQAGHRQYAKRQMTWFRRERALHPVHWLEGTGDDPRVLEEAWTLVAQHLCG